MPEKTSAEQDEVLRIAAETLRQFKHDFEEASRKKDRAALERMIHDDFTLVNPQGGEVNKKTIIQDIVDGRSNFMAGFTRTERRTALQLGGARETADLKLEGNLSHRGNITGHYIVSSTFLKGPDGWQMAGNTLHKLADSTVHKL